MTAVTENIGDASSGRLDRKRFDPIVIEPRAIAIDETDNYTIDPEDRPYVRRIYGTYLYDSNARTFACSATPQYFLIHLGDYIELSRAGRRLPLMRQEKLVETYEYLGGEDGYWRCDEIETLFRNGRRTKRSRRLQRVTVVEDETYDGTMDALREHYRANPPV